jgi:hypothetical protein
MQIVFQSRDAEAAELRSITIQRVQFAMRRLSWLVPTAKVQLSDINGPHGGVDKRCQLEFKTASSGIVVVTAIARDWSDALNGALHRASRKLTRGLQRNRNQLRVRQTATSFDG